MFVVYQSTVGPSTSSPPDDTDFMKCQFREVLLMSQNSDFVLQSQLVGIIQLLRCFFSGTTRCKDVRNTAEQRNARWILVQNSTSTGTFAAHSLDMR